MHQHRAHEALRAVSEPAEPETENGEWYWIWPGKRVGRAKEQRRGKNAARYVGTWQPAPQQMLDENVERHHRQNKDQWARAVPRRRCTRLPPWSNSQPWCGCPPSAESPRGTPPPQGRGHLRR